MKTFNKVLLAGAIAASFSGLAMAEPVPVGGHQGWADNNIFEFGGRFGIDKDHLSAVIGDNESINGSFQTELNTFAGKIDSLKTVETTTFSGIEAAASAFDLSDQVDTLKNIQAVVVDEQGVVDDLFLSGGLVDLAIISKVNSYEARLEVIGTDIEAVANLISSDMTTGDGSLSDTTLDRIDYAEFGMDDVRAIASDFTAIDTDSEWMGPDHSKNSVMKGGYTLAYTAGTPADTAAGTSAVAATLLATVQGATSASDLRVFVPELTTGIPAVLGDDPSTPSVTETDFVVTAAIPADDAYFYGYTADPAPEELLSDYNPTFVAAVTQVGVEGDTNYVAPVTGVTGTVLHTDAPTGL